MNKKIIGLIRIFIVLFICIKSAFATDISYLQNNTLVYLPMETNTTIYNLVNTTNGTLTGGSNIPGIIGYAVKLSTAGISFNKSIGKIYSVNFWVQGLQTAGNRILYTTSALSSYMDSSKQYLFCGTSNCASQVLKAHTTINSTITWHMITISINESGTNKIYIDGVNDALDINTLTNNVWINSTWTIGSEGATICTNCVFDEFFIVNKSLTQTEVTALWNNGNGITYPFHSCVENWTNDNNNCTNNIYTLTYHDINSCGTFNYLPANNGTSVLCTNTEATQTDFTNLYGFLLLLGLIGLFIYSEHENKVKE